jgi:hypothetical protein
MSNNNVSEICHYLIHDSQVQEAVTRFIRLIKSLPHILSPNPSAQQLGNISLPLILSPNPSAQQLGYASLPSHASSPQINSNQAGLQTSPVNNTKKFSYTCLLREHKT